MPGMLTTPMTFIELSVGVIASRTYQAIDKPEIIYPLLRKIWSHHEQRLLSNINNDFPSSFTCCIPCFYKYLRVSYRRAADVGAGLPPAGAQCQQQLQLVPACRSGGQCCLLSSLMRRVLGYDLTCSHTLTKRRRTQKTLQA